MYQSIFLSLIIIFIRVSSLSVVVKRKSVNQHDNLLLGEEYFLFGKIPLKFDR